MLPSRFEYHRPESLEEAFQLLSQYGDDAKVLAGGQSLLPMMNLGVTLLNKMGVPVTQIADSTGTLRDL